MILTLFNLLLVSLKNDVLYYKILFFIIFILFCFTFWWTYDTIRENYQLHREAAEVDVKTQQWNQNVERIQKFVYEYLEDQKIFKNN